MGIYSEAGLMRVQKRIEWDLAEDGWLDAHVSRCRLKAALDAKGIEMQEERDRYGNQDRYAGAQEVLRWLRGRISNGKRLRGLSATKRGAY